jgi:hypothetical protein
MAIKVSELRVDLADIRSRADAEKLRGLKPRRVMVVGSRDGKSPDLLNYLFSQVLWPMMGGGAHADIIDNTTGGLLIDARDKP